MRHVLRDDLTCLVLGPPFVVVCVLVVRRGLLYPTLARSSVPK